MDYGVFLKSTVENPGRKSAHHVHQSPFEGSDRQLRGRVLKALVEKGKCSQAAIIEVNPDERERILSILLKLEQEGLIVKEKRSYRIA
jgi:A/G-specific adenine glycosylase